MKVFRASFFLCIARYVGIFIAGMCREIVPQKPKKLLQSVYASQHFDSQEENAAAVLRGYAHLYTELELRMHWPGVNGHYAELCWQALSHGITDKTKLIGP